MRQFSGTTGLLMAVAMAALVAGCDAGTRVSSAREGEAAMELVRLPPGEVSYYPPGEYLEQGFPATPPVSVTRFEHGLLISKRQVSQAEYAECVRDEGCKPLDRGVREAVAPDKPVVGVSWRDATAYAAWLSRRTGEHYRLPTYAEWVYAAGSAHYEDIITAKFEPSDPAQRWLAEYALETQRKAVVDAAPRVFGGFGTNELGLLDMAGNVWDWTDTCHTRQHLDLLMPAGGSADGVRHEEGNRPGTAERLMVSSARSAGTGTGAGENCGIRVVAGPHRSSITDFIRDPKSGACSVGVPPSNLGFRLVRDAAARPDRHARTLRERLGLS